MECYNSRGEIENIDIELPKIKAINSNIYELKNGIYFKKYFNWTSLDIRITYDLFKILREVNSSFTNRILELYYDLTFNKEFAFLLKEKPNLFTTKAYKYIYIEEESRDILRESSEYFLYNVQGLEELLTKIFVQYSVRVEDLKRANSVFYNDRIVLIDLDKCRVRNDINKEILFSWNMDGLKFLLFDLFIKSQSYNKECLNGIHDLLWTNSYNESIYKVLSKRLVKFKTPLDYIKNR